VLFLRSPVRLQNLDFRCQYLFFRYFRPCRKVPGVEYKFFLSHTLDGFTPVYRIKIG